MDILEKLSDIFHFSPKGFEEFCLTLGALIFLIGVGLSIPGIGFNMPGFSDLGGVCMVVGAALMAVGILIFILEKAGVLGEE